MCVKVCSDVESTRLVCVTPPLQLPAPLRYFIDDIYAVYTPKNVTNDAIGPDIIPPEVTSLLERGHVDDGRNNTMYVYVGLTFDGNSRFRNLTETLGRNGSMVIVPGPTLHKPKSSSEILQLSDLFPLAVSK